MLRRGEVHHREHDGSDRNPGAAKIREFTCKRLPDEGSLFCAVCVGENAALATLIASDTMIISID